MKIPDKVYIREYPDVIAHFWEERKKEDVVATIPHEYIRKDTLIEWLLKGIEMSEICHSEYGDACAQTYQAVIDKINSL